MRSLVSRIARRLSGLQKPESTTEVGFQSTRYWISRYGIGQNSGAGSYGQLAEFKARVLNDFVARENISSVVELGCGDGNQLSLYSFASYIGLDVSPDAIQRCIDRFANDTTKSFALFRADCTLDNHGMFRADLALSLDVVYHLVEDEVFDAYMACLFHCARKYVIIYSSNCEQPAGTARHVKHRTFTKWVSEHIENWHLSDVIRNEYPRRHAQSREGTSLADFYVYGRSASKE